MTAKQIANLLESLGKTADEVALSLKRKRISGDTVSACHCPLANFLKRSGVKAPCVELGMRRVSFFGTRRKPVPLPNACCDFADAFDDGRYEGLQRKRRTVS